MDKRDKYEIAVYKGQTAATEARKELETTKYVFRQGYNVQNALSAAISIFEEHDNFPKCSRESKKRAMLDMLVQGLNPLKGQCSFVPFGNELILVRDYSGSIMVARDSDSRITDIRAEVIREGDHFDFEIINGLKCIKQHKRSIKSWNADIIGVYALAVDANEKIVDIDMMSWEDCINTWKQTRIRVKGNGDLVVRNDDTLHPFSNHAKYPEKMTIKTVIHRLCRRIIKSSSNKMLEDAYDRSDEDRLYNQDEPNNTPLDFDNGQVIDAEFNSGESVRMAIKSQAEDIFELERSLGNVANGFVMERISSFVGRQVNRVGELTFIEASQYIAKLGVEIQNESKDPEPDPAPEPGPKIDPKPTIKTPDWM